MPASADPRPVSLTCPYCGESFETLVDLSAGAQRYIEDCAVCCCPIEITLEVDDRGDLARIQLQRDDE